MSEFQQEGESFLSHLVELRNRLVRAFLAVIVVTVCLLPFASMLYDFLAFPMMHALPEGTRMIATDVVTPFLVPVKMMLLVALVVTLPYLLYQAWAFIAPGLYQHEKRLVLPLVMASTVLFFVGMAFCYFFVFGVVFKFVYSIAPKSISVAPDIENYFNFAIGMFLAFGVTFEVPIVVIVLAKMGIVSVDKLHEIRPYVIVGSFVIAAIVTPPDVVSQLLLAIPLCVLYEVGILVAAMFTPRPAPRLGVPEGIGLGVPEGVVRLLAGALRFGPLADGELERDGVAVAQQLQRRHGTGLQRRHDVEHGRGVGHGLAVDLHQDVARAYAGAVGRTAAQHAGDQHAFGSAA